MLSGATTHPRSGRAAVLAWHVGLWGLREAVSHPQSHGAGLRSRVASELWFSWAMRRAPLLLQAMQGCTGGHRWVSVTQHPESDRSPMFLASGTGSPRDLLSARGPAGVRGVTEGSRKTHCGRTEQGPPCERGLLAVVLSVALTPRTLGAARGVQLGRDHRICILEALIFAVRMGLREGTLPNSLRQSSGTRRPGLVLSPPCLMFPLITRSHLQAAGPGQGLTCRASVSPPVHSGFLLPEFLCTFRTPRGIQISPSLLPWILV